MKKGKNDGEIDIDSKNSRESTGHEDEQLMPLIL
jgi:hypothetical protein